MTITLTREEAQQVLDVIERNIVGVPRYRATELLRARLAQPEPEPVAWWHDMGDVVDLNVSGRGTPLYFAPPQREWVGIEDEEIRRTDHHRVDGAYDYSFKQGARWAEAKLKEKNT